MAMASLLEAGWTMVLLEGVVLEEESEACCLEGKRQIGQQTVRIRGLSDCRCRVGPQVIALLSRGACLVQFPNKGTCPSQLRCLSGTAVLYELLWNKDMLKCVGFSYWKYLITHFSEFQLATLGTFIVHESVFFLSGLPSLCFERAGLFNQYKIQKKSNTPDAQGKCVMRLILYHVCVNLPVMIVSYPAFRYMGLRSSLPLPPWSVILSQILFYFILEDFVFYWGHRVLHTKWLYKHVHSIHHEYATPFGLTSEYAHPAEILFLGFATIIGPALTGPHMLTLWLWVILRVLETVEAHSGYHFPWSPAKFLPLYGGAEFHDYHHRVLYTKSGNYSSTFIYMDWLFGTDKGYRKLKALEE